MPDTPTLSDLDWLDDKIGVGYWGIVNDSLTTFGLQKRVLFVREDVSDKIITLARLQFL
jgi:hypothetical protein